MIIDNGHLKSDALDQQVAIVTGAARGIGFEAVRSLMRLGARCIIADIETSAGQEAALNLAREFGQEQVLFLKTNVGSRSDVRKLKAKAVKAFGRVDIVVNNATIAPIGSVEKLSIDYWDRSYGVNLRGPVLLAQAFLSDMIKRGYGVFVCVTSSGLEYMGAYETLKAAQSHLASTLDAELEGTGVFAFSIGPGLVLTPGAKHGVSSLALLHGMSEEDFYEANKEHIVPVEVAGAGFAAAVAQAKRFAGQEISSLQALSAAGVKIGDMSDDCSLEHLKEEEILDAHRICGRVYNTLLEQSEGWKKRSLFERQWMLRDFKKNAGMTVEQWLDSLRKLEAALATGTGRVTSLEIPLQLLDQYYGHLKELASSYEKNREKLSEHLIIISNWQEDVSALRKLIGR